MQKRILKCLLAGFLLLLLGCPARFVAQSPPSASASPTAGSAPRLSGTVRLIAIRRNGQPVTDLKPEDVRLRLNGQDRKILSVASTASLPKTIGIYFDGGYSRGFDVLVGKEMGTVIRILESVWREHDVGYVVSFSDKIYEDVLPTDDLAQIEKAFPKILSRDFDRPPGWNSGWVYRWPHMRQYGNMLWYDALSSVSLHVPQTGGGEKIYIIVSDLVGSKIDNSARKAILDQQARIFALLLVPDPGGGSECVYSDDPCYLGIWSAERSARRIGEKTGGDVFAVERKKDLERAQTRLTNDLRSNYIVTYEPLPKSVSTGKIEILCKLSSVRLLYARE